MHRVATPWCAHLSSLFLLSFSVLLCQQPCSAIVGTAYTPNSIWWVEFIVESQFKLRCPKRNKCPRHNSLWCAAYNDRPPHRQLRNHYIHDSDCHKPSIITANSCLPKQNHSVDRWSASLQHHRTPIDLAEYTLPLFIILGTFPTTLYKTFSLHQPVYQILKSDAVSIIYIG